MKLVEMKPILLIFCNDVLVEYPTDMPYGGFPGQLLESLHHHHRLGLCRGGVDRYGLWSSTFQCMKHSVVHVWDRCHVTENAGTLSVDGLMGV
jgi:hypothetical protein